MFYTAVLDIERFRLEMLTLLSIKSPQCGYICANLSEGHVMHIPTNIY